MRYLFVTLFFFSQFSHAQTTGDANKSLYRPDSLRLPDIRERLVQLALQNPQYEMTDHAAIAAGYQVKIAKSAYLGMFAAQGNINEYTITPPATQGTYPYYYPKYNFGVNVPFDIFSKTTNNVKIARENQYIANAAKNEKFREIKADVLTKYENYLLAKQLVEFQSKLTQGEYSTYKRAESDFAENLVKLDDVEKAQRGYILEQVKSLTLQKDLNVTKIELEKVIGARIEDVERGVR
jgi:outer membrane protein TolC